MPRLDLAVVRGSEIPVGTQLIWKLRTLIATGALSPGDRLPGIREVAQAAGVNVNTVRSVFSRLEEQGLLSTEHGRGTFVTSRAQRGEILAEMAAAALAQAREAGIDPRELAAALYVSPSRGVSAPQTLGGEERVQDERAERRRLREEIAHLERELASLDPLGRWDVAGERGEPRLLSVEELRHIRHGLTERINGLRRERVEWRLEEERKRLEEEAEERKSARAAHWRGAGVWTGRRPARVSWTAP
jgi:DNA-binding transcriptional regulator YhcF (GntR family)